MNSLTKSLAKDLKLLLKKFPNKASINLYDAKEYMSKTLNISIDLLDDNLIHTYLKQKGYKEILKNTQKTKIQKIDSQEINIQKNTFDIDSIDLDMDLDHLLDFDFNSDNDLFDSVDIEEIDINHKHHSYDNNKELLSEHSKTKNPIIVEELMNNNRFLVIKFAKFYKKIIGVNTSLDEDDLVQAGMIGLHKAINKYDIDKGSQFSTYAVFWIKQSITREIMDNGNVVRIPVHLGQDLLKLNKLESNSILTFGHIDIEYVCKKMNISKSKYNSFKEIDYKFSKMKSIDVYVNEESAETSIIDLLASKNNLVDLSDDFLDPMELALKNVFSQNLLKCLDKLTEKEKDIILLRFGFVDGTPHTLEDIGSKYNVTRERIRQIEAKALKKLRRSKSLRQLIKDDDNTQKDNKKSDKKINALSKKTNNIKNCNTKLTSNKINTTGKKVTHSVINNKLKDVRNINPTTKPISILKSAKSVSNCISSNNNSEIIKNTNSSTISKTNVDNNENIDNTQKIKKKSDRKINTLSKITSDVKNYSNKHTSNEINKTSKKVTHSVIDDKLKDVRNINPATESSSILKSAKSVNNCISLNNNSEVINNTNSSTISKTNVDNNENIVNVSSSIHNFKIPIKVSISSSPSDNAKIIKNGNGSNVSNKKPINYSKKLDTIKNTKNNIVDKVPIENTNISSAKKNSLKYNVDCFKKDVSKEFFNKLKSKYKGEYLLAEEYSQLALSVKVYHTKCGSEFYTKSSTLLRKRPSCPFCEYKDYIASKKK